MLAPKAKTIEAIVSDGDTVAVCVFGEGTNLGKLNGVVPPTGKRFSSTRAIGSGFDNGKLAEHWATRDDLTAMLQLGVIARPGPPWWVRPLIWLRRRTRR